MGHYLGTRLAVLNRGPPEVFLVSLRTGTVVGASIDHNDEKLLVVGSSFPRVTIISGTYELDP